MAGPNSLDLRLLAESLDRHESASGFKAARMPPKGLSVEWSDGCVCPGYRELSQAMSVVVSRRFAELREEALSDLRREVDERRAKVFGPGA